MSDQNNTLYPWDEIPAEFTWAATDRNGMKYAYTIEPYTAETGWITLGSHMLCLDSNKGGRFCDDWRESLERRPGMEES